jgi:hypothetical protein
VPQEWVPVGLEPAEGPSLQAEGVLFLPQEEGGGHDQLEPVELGLELALDLVDL